MSRRFVNGIEVTQQVNMVGGRMYLDADRDTYFDPSTDDVLTLIIGGSIIGTFNANGLRVGDNAAPTVSLEAANGLTVAAGDIVVTGGIIIATASGFSLRSSGFGGMSVQNAGGGIANMYCNVAVVNAGYEAKADAAYLRANNADNHYLAFFARDNGVGRAEVARLEGDAEPRLCHTRPVNLLGADASELTISTGAITITAGVHTVDTEGDAASDDLDTINGGRTGDILVIMPANAARTVVTKHGTGNLNLSGGGDFTMDEDDDFLVLLLIGSTWQEISRSENHA